MYQLWCQYVKRFGRETANELTDRRKHGTDSITSTADTGGNKRPSFWLIACPLPFIFYLKLSVFFLHIPFLIWTNQDIDTNDILFCG